MSGLKRVAFAAVVAMAAMPALAAPMSTAEYLAKAGASDLFERESAEVVLDGTKNKEVGTFAQMMLADHAQSTQLVMQAAAQSGFHPLPPSLSAKQLRMLADLKDAKGEHRDAVYIEQQRDVHDEALKLQQDYALGGGVPAVKAAAARIVPVVQQHITLLQAMPVM
ncbi:DUF4142 domain-containing protein [Sphingomonas nostoxanthinifaciens]|uniref:DUF4142 domain-containing protein n=1 Tax=Sphingomonas nostoxanthinifaciens TaxID=2872652 RepID=UPI001CC1E07D|nr:DUF4142 domain-containing protein [Sphingomonas nostoxanthinifaciens]UAK24856.1 DUF4142 domain-containing protein [Sphingomonas nostoxanthinifaciens]